MRGLRLIALDGPEDGLMLLVESALDPAVEHVAFGRPFCVDGDAVARQIVRPPDLLTPHMTVGETLDFVLSTDVGRDERSRRVEETLAVVGLDRYADVRPAQLSGGERQRLAIARAIVTRPSVFAFW